MPALWSGIGKQLRKPEGLLGRITGRAMQLANARANALAVAALAPRLGEHIAELGCGPGQALRRILASGSGRVVGIDHSATMIAQARQGNAVALGEGRLTLLRADFSTLPMETGSMDGVLAVNVAYFMEDATAIAEACRVLRPGGRLVLYVTASSTMQNWRFAGPHSHRLFDASQLRKLIASGGFSDSTMLLSNVKAGAGINGYIVIARKRGQVSSQSCIVGIPHHEWR